MRTIDDTHINIPLDKFVKYEVEKCFVTSAEMEERYNKLSKAVDDHKEKVESRVLPVKMDLNRLPNLLKDIRDCNAPNLKSYSRSETLDELSSRQYLDLLRDEKGR